MLSKQSKLSRLPYVLYAHLGSSDLKGESYGVDLLQAIGFVYVAKSKHFLASNQTLFGVGGWLHNVQGKYHVFSETYVFCQGFLFYG